MFIMSKISKLPVYTNQPTMTRLQDARIIQTEALAPDFTLAYMKSDQPVQGNAASQQILVNAGNNLLYKGTLISVDELQQLYTVLFYTGKQQEYNTPTIALAAGDRVRIAIEKNRLYYQPQATHHFFFGDETAIGVFNAFIEMALENDQEYFGVLECAQHGETALKKLNLLLQKHQLTTKLLPKLKVKIPKLQKLQTTTIKLLNLKHNRFK